MKTIDFEVLQESWNKYKLEDNTILKHRIVLTKVNLEGVSESGEPNYGIGTQKLTTVMAPKELKGKPSREKYQSKEVRDSIEKEDLDFEIIKEEWNEYKLEDGVILKIKPAIVTIARTSLFDPTGDPIYIINSQPLINPKITEDVIEKYQKKK